MIRAAVAALVLLAVVAAAGAAFVQYLDRPVVYKSWSSQQCIKVEDPASEAKGLKVDWSCANLPPSYELVWVR